MTVLGPLCPSTYIRGDLGRGKGRAAAKTLDNTKQSRINGTHHTLIKSDTVLKAAAEVEVGREAACRGGRKGGQARTV